MQRSLGRLITVGILGLLTMGILNWKMPVSAQESNWRETAAFMQGVVYGYQVSLGEVFAEFQQTKNLVYAQSRLEKLRQGNAGLVEMVNRHLNETSSSLEHEVYSVFLAATLEMNTIISNTREAVTAEAIHGPQTAEPFWRDVSGYVATLDKFLDNSAKKLNLKTDWREVVQSAKSRPVSGALLMK